MLDRTENVFPSTAGSEESGALHFLVFILRKKAADNMSLHEGENFRISCTDGKAIEFHVQN